jgi:uncharacterized membrane protein YhaH (DUF805 family)/DNA-directed RNA polymerase subunit H (RpoH/RPB5)
MATKKELLKNLRSFTPEEIAEAVKDGTVTLYELAKESEGAFTPLLRKRVKELLDKQTPAQITESETISESVPSNPSPISDTEAPPFLNSIQIDTEEIPTIQENQPIVQEAVVGIDTIDNRGMFKKPFSFSGRIRRLEYGISFIIYFVWYVFIDVAEKSPNLSQGTAIVILISLIPMLWFVWAQNCKRCHDRGNSGWYQLIPFYFVVLLFGDGEPGENEYGTNPKE